jgi:hypothetical protein
MTHLDRLEPCKGVAQDERPYRGSSGSGCGDATAEKNQTMGMMGRLTADFGSTALERIEK